MSWGWIVILIAAGLMFCGLLSALAFKASGRSLWPGLALGAVLGPVGLLIAVGLYMTGGPSYPDNTGTFATPHAGPDKKRFAPQGTGTFAPYHRGLNKAGERRWPRTGNSI
jgi:hypothetical protein